MDSRSRRALRLWRRRVETAAGSAARSAGYELRRSSYYLPLPDVDRLPDSLWTARRETPGLDLHLDDAAALFERMAPMLRDFPPGFPTVNGSYEWGDAETLWGMLRQLKPRHVIELGSGASTRVIELAQSANRAEGHPFVLESYDPFPGSHPLRPEKTIVKPIAAQNIEPADIAVLADGDVLFIDTTHTVKTGGEVAHIVLNLLPSLRPGVYVHFHDIFLPYEYPRRWVVDERRAWGEQYLLQAFLTFNDAFVTILPVHALWRQRSELMGSLLPSSRAGSGEGPGAFWIRRAPEARAESSPDQ